jgi:hypothetical protein
MKMRYRDLFKSLFGYFCRGNEKTHVLTIRISQWISEIMCVNHLAAKSDASNGFILRRCTNYSVSELSYSDLLQDTTRKI